MMKKLILLFTLSLAAIALVEASRRSTTATVITDGKFFEATSQIEDVLIETIHDFRKLMREWESNDITTLEEILNDPLIAQSPTTNYSVAITGTSINYMGYNKKTRAISCLFGDSLRVQMPIQNIQFRSSMTISSNKLAPVTYDFSINFNDVNFTFNAESNFNIGEGLPNNQSEVDVSYRRITVDIEIPDNDEYSAVEEVNGVLKRIKSSLRSLVQDKLTTIIQEKVSYLSIFTTCIRFKNEIAHKHRIFLANDRQYVYVINNTKDVDSWNSVYSKIDSVEIAGLLNFDSLALDKTYNGYTKFTFQIINLEGRASWSYYIDKDIRHSTKFNFTADSISISGIFYDGYSWNDANVEFEPLLQNDIKSDNNWISFSKTVIMKQLKEVIASFLRSQLPSRFNRRY